MTHKINEEVTLSEAVKYHLDERISFTENVFRPGSEKFFELIREAKKLYERGLYVPADEWEIDLRRARSLSEMLEALPSNKNNSLKCTI